MASNKVTFKKITLYGLLIVVFLSIYFNYHLYKENQSFKVRIGSDYQGTVAGTLFRLKEGDVDFWVETLKNEENGDVRLERYIGNLNEIINGYSGMDSKVGIIRIQIKHIISQYRELEKHLNEGKEIEGYKEEINRHITFIREVLKQVQSDLGKDGNEVLWYNELSGDDTKTGNFIWEKYKKFQSDNK